MPLPPQPVEPNQIPPERAASALVFGAGFDEYVTIEPDPDAELLQEDEHGNSYVDMPGQRAESPPPDMEFYGNLAAVIPDDIQNTIVQDLLRRIEEDKDARKKRDEQYEEGIKRTGLGKDAPGGAQFEGASRVVHPMLTEACIDCESRLIKELFPPAGPVKPNIIGAVTAEKQAQASRVADHMNWQITTQIKEARGTLETLLTQVPLGGSQYLRQYWDNRLKRPRWEFAPIDQVWIPYGAADFASASRKTFSELVDMVEFKQRVDQGMYLDLKLSPVSTLDEPTRAQVASNKVEGVEIPAANVDDSRNIYEVSTYWQVPEEAEEYLGGVEKTGEMSPYLISIDVTTRKMLAMYRDWERGDEAREPIEHMFEFPFIPWRGPYAIGFPQIIGSLSATATGALRALLDSAHTNNAISGFVLKGAGISGQNKRPEIGALLEIDAGVEADDVRKRVMPAPFNAPSSVLFQLLGFVVDSARGIVRTSMDDTPSSGPAPTPVGTQMSRVEEGMVVFSAVHGRSHAALDRVLKGLHRLNRLYLPDSLKVDAAGREILVRRRDYEGPCCVQPVSQPTIYSETQRFNQLNYIQQRAMVNPALWNMREVEMAGLKLVKWPDPETLLVQQPTPEDVNAVAENMAMAMGRPTAVFPGQDHLAHLQVLLDFVSSPVLGSNPMLATVYLPAALQHANQHIVHFYGETMNQIVGEAAAAIGKKIEELLTPDPKVKMEYDRLLAQASQIVTQKVGQALQNVMPVLMKAGQMLSQLMPKPPMDPATAAVQAASAETARKAQADQTDAHLGAATLQSKTQLAVQANQIAADRVQAMREGQQIASQTKESTTAADNETALEISADHLAAGKTTTFTNGESMSRQ